jgi:two-component system response regulator HydG
VEGLALALLRRIAHRMGATITGYTAAAMMHIQHYHWPGNVRELENIIERACALAVGSLIDVSDLPRELRVCLAPGPSRVADIRPLPDLEREHILATLRRNGGNKTETARQLKIARATLFRKLRHYAVAS